MSNQLNLPNSESISLIIIYRSLYILKHKFQQFKPQLIEIYKKYSQSKINTKEQNAPLLIKVNISSFNNILKEILSLINMLIVQIKNPNELYIYDYISPEKQKTLNENITEIIYKYIIDKLKKYNELYYNKKIYPLELINKYTVDDRDNYPIVEYNKKGKIIHSFDELKRISDENCSLMSQREEKKEEYESLEQILKYTNILFIETLPVIIADFIQNNNSYAIIDLENDELTNEVRNLFDKEILSKISKENKAINKEIIGHDIIKEEEIKDLLKEKLNIVRNIKLYEELKSSKLKNKENVQYIDEMLLKLTKEKGDIDVKIKRKELSSIQKDIRKSKSDYSTFQKMFLSKTEESTKPKKVTHIKSKSEIQKLPLPMSSKDKTEQALNEIFHFYSNQHHYAGNSPTFDDIQRKSNYLDIAEFSKFCVEFQIKIPKEKIVELYKKNTSNQKEMHYSDFIKSLNQMSRAFNSNKINTLSKKIDKIKEKLLTMKTETNEGLTEFRRKSIYNSPSKKKSPRGFSSEDDEEDNFNSHRVSPRRASQLFESKKRTMQNELHMLEDKLNQLKGFTFDEQFKEFVKYIGVDDKNTYKKKMKGFIIPFHNMKERNLFFEGEDQFFRIKNTLTLEKIEKIKKEKKKEKEIQKEIIKQNNYNKKIIKFENNNKKLEEHYTEKMKVKNYIGNYEKRIVFDKEARGEYNYNWNRIENTAIDDLSLDNKDKELFIDSDNSDDIELLKHLNNENNSADKTKKNTCDLGLLNNSNKKENNLLIISNDNKEISQIKPKEISQSTSKMKISESKDNVLMTQQKKNQQSSSKLIQKEPLAIKIEDQSIKSKRNMKNPSSFPIIPTSTKSLISSNIISTSQSIQMNPLQSSQPQLSLPYINRNMVVSTNQNYNSTSNLYQPINSYPNYRSQSSVNSSPRSNKRNPFVSSFRSNNVLTTSKELEKTLEKKNEIYSNRVKENLDLIDKIRESQNVKFIQRIEKEHRKKNIYPYLERNQKILIQNN